MGDRYSPLCPCGCHAPRPRKTFEPPHEPCCCCNYNPFSDDAKEMESYDLPFALRKLTVMNCQMKKWRMERLQLESENRSLKQALQSLGIDAPLYSRISPFSFFQAPLRYFMRHLSCARSIFDVAIFSNARYSILK